MSLANKHHWQESSITKTGKEVIPPIGTTPSEAPLLASYVLSHEKYLVFDSHKKQD